MIGRNRQISRALTIVGAILFSLSACGSDASDIQASAEETTTTTAEEERDSEPLGLEAERAAEDDAARQRLDSWGPSELRQWARYQLVLLEDEEYQKAWSRLGKNFIRGLSNDDLESYSDAWSQFDTFQEIAVEPLGDGPDGEPRILVAFHACKDACKKGDDDQTHWLQWTLGVEDGEIKAVHACRTSREAAGECTG